MFPHTRLLTALALCFVPQALAGDTSVPEDLQPIVELYNNGKLFDRQAYRTVRTAFATAFQRKHEQLIRAAYGDDHDELTAWLAKNPDIQVEFYTAINEERDNLPRVLSLFRDLWKRNPEDVRKYPGLAIATAVVWDDPRLLYDYTGHQRRTHSLMPEGVLNFTALDNFAYFVKHAREIQGPEGVNRLQIMPWEFLVYVVDHRTPVVEREWALHNYLHKRPMIGKVYSEIAYDKEMLRTKSKVCKLSGHPYTLASIRQHGGVCAMQADFAARVAKSLAVPAASVTGQSVYLDNHAWVMWVEIHGASAGKISFTLESHGRYLGDFYFTGQLHDPQTGEKILDRDLERRLGGVALDNHGKRQADLIMKAFPWLSQQKHLTARQKFRYLGACLKVSHYNEAVWLELARQVKTGELEADSRSTVLDYLDSLLRTYARYPDFTWKLAGDLLLIQPDKAARNKVYERLVNSYELAGRPDLACQARLRWADYPCEQKQWLKAARGLTITINKFPAEGRYVPQMMTRLREVCGNFKEGKAFLSRFYLAVLSRIPPLRGDAPSDYCISMYEQAIDFLRENQQNRVADQLAAQLQLIKSRKPRS